MPRLLVFSPTKEDAMHSKQPLWVTHQKKVLHVMRLGVIIALFASAVFAAQPFTAKAATPTCTNFASATALDWGSAASWNCGHVPTSADDVVIANDTEVNISSSQSVHNLTIGVPGTDTLDALIFTQPATLLISGDLNYTLAGLFDATSSGGSVNFVGNGTQTINTNNQVLEFWNFKKVGGGLTLAFQTGIGEVAVLNNLTLRGSPTANLMLRSTVASTPWKIESVKTRDLNWLDVKDSNNVTLSAPFMSVHTWVDSTGNSGWASITDTSSSVAVATLSNPLIKGQSLTLNIRVYPVAATGEIEVKVDSADVAGCNMLPLDVDGTTTCTITSLELGSHSVDVSFISTSSYADATATTLIQDVTYGIFIPSLNR
jgi:hypothetical protein